MLSISENPFIDLSGSIYFGDFKFYTSQSMDLNTSMKI